MSLESVGSEITTSPLEMCAVGGLVRRALGRRFGRVTTVPVCRENVHS